MELILIEAALLLSVIGEIAGIGIVQQPRNPPAFDIPALKGCAPEAMGSHDQAGLSDRIEALKIADHVRRSCVIYRTQQGTLHYVPSSASKVLYREQLTKPSEDIHPDAPNGQASGTSWLGV